MGFMTTNVAPPTTIVEPGSVGACWGSRMSTGRGGF